MIINIIVLVFVIGLQWFLDLGESFQTIAYIAMYIKSINEFFADVKT